MSTASSQSRPSELKVIVGTWNVAEKHADPLNLELIHDIRLWLQMDKHSDVDVFALALQEIDMSGTALVQERTSRKQQWEDTLHRVFKNMSYLLVEARQLVGMCLFVFLHMKHVEFVRNRCANIQREGLFGGALGNKGSVSIRFELYGRTFCFINVHLTAHMHNMEARNANLRNILQRTEFFLNRDDIFGERSAMRNSSSSSSSSSSSGRRGGGNGDNNSLHLADEYWAIHNEQPLLIMDESDNVHHILQEREQEQEQEQDVAHKTASHGIAVLEHDFIFIAGDFNYRIEATRGLMSAKDVVQKIHQRRFQILKMMDQMTQQIKRNIILQGYTEGEITFPPTYKFIPGTNDYSTKKKRIPSFCDRIFFRSTVEGMDIRQLSYGSGGSKLSDHKPVYAAFMVPLLLSSARITSFFTDDDTPVTTANSADHVTYMPKVTQGSTWVNPPTYSRYSIHGSPMAMDDSALFTLTSPSGSNSQHNNSINRPSPVSKNNAKSRSSMSLTPPQTRREVVPPPPPKALLMKKNFEQYSKPPSQLPLPRPAVSEQKTWQRHSSKPLPTPPTRFPSPRQTLDPNRALPLRPTTGLSKSQGSNNIQASNSGPIANRNISLTQTRIRGSDDWASRMSVLDEFLQSPPRNRNDNDGDGRHDGRFTTTASPGIKNVREIVNNIEGRPLV